MPSVLEINNEDTSSSSQIDHHHHHHNKFVDETHKLRSPSVRTAVEHSKFVDQSVAVHALSSMNQSSNNNQNVSASFVFANSMKPLTTNDELKKTHQQLYQQHTASQTIHQQMSQQQQQHPVLISTSPPNLINHMNNLDNMRRVQNQYQLSNMQRISSPSNLIYNSQAQQIQPQTAPTLANASAVNNVNIYQQIANQMKNMHHAQTNSMLPPHQQFATANHFATQQHLLQQHQRQQLGQPINQQNINMNFAVHQAQVGPPPPPTHQQQLQAQIQNQQLGAPPPQSQQVNDFHHRLHQAPTQSMPLAASAHLMKHVVQSPFAGQPVVPQSLHPGANALTGQPVQNQSMQGPPNAFYQNQSLQNVQKQNAAVAASYYGQMQPQQHLAQQMQQAPPPQQQQFNYMTSQQFGLINNAQNTQLSNAQNYRNQKFR